MVKILAFLVVSLILSTQAQDTSQSNPLAYPLIQSPSGYLINVNLQENFSAQASSSNVGYMLIATYASKTILASTSIPSSSLDPDSNCVGFMHYNCTNNSICFDAMSSKSASTTYSSPYFIAQLSDPVAGLIQVPQLSDTTSTSGTISTAFDVDAVELASSCQTKEFNTFGQAAYGVIGLANRNANDVFAIYIEPISDNAILFQSSIAFDYASTDTPVLRLPTNYTSWTVSDARSIYVGQSSVSFSSKDIIFDINSDAIGLSADIFPSFLNMLSSLSIFSCYGEYLPVCTYSGSISRLPDIIIGVGAQNITIPPQVYINGYEENPLATTAITLNFKLIDSSRIGSCYVTDAYSNNTIILDANFLKYYFTVFNGESSTIDLYRAENSTAVTLASRPTFGADPSIMEESESTSPSLNLTVKVVFSISAFALVGLCLWYYLYRRRNKPLSSLSRNINPSEISLTTQRSAIFNQTLEL